MQSLIEFLREQKEIAYGVYAAALAGFMSWYRNERFKEVLWNAVVTGIVFYILDDITNLVGLSTQNSGKGVVLLIICYVGVKVVLDKITSIFGLKKNK